MKFYDYFIFLLQIETYYKYQQYFYSSLKYEYYYSVFLKKKPLIGFEPMTYALPWRYSTTELKGPRMIQFLNKELFNIIIPFICSCIYLLYNYINYSKIFLL